MTARLYLNNADTLVCDKSAHLTQLAEVNVVPYGDFDLLKPRIKIDVNNFSTACNYVYLSDFGNYYFVTNKVGLTAQHIILDLYCDLRYTWRNVIRNSNVTATRSNMKNKNIPDTMVLNVPQEKVTYRKLGNALTGNNYILVVGG